MVSTSVISMSMPTTCSAQKKVLVPSKEAFFKPLSVNPSKSVSKNVGGKFQVKASLKEKAATGLTAAALTVSMVVPQVAEAAESGVPASLKNFLLSIAAGSIVVVAILGAVLGVSNFDPVKRS